MEKAEIKQGGRHRNANTAIAGFLFGLVAIYFLFFYGKGDTYRPYYYQNKYNLTNYIKGPDFSSLEEAREWVYEQNRIRGDTNWDYEIGKNPKPSKYGDIEICEETLR